MKKRPYNLTDMLFRMLEAFTTISVLCRIESAIRTAEIPCGILKDIGRKILADLLRVIVWQVWQGRELQCGLGYLALVVPEKGLQSASIQRPA
jgi:hypothetical protein